MDDIKIRLSLDGADQVAAGASKAADGIVKVGEAGKTAGAGQQQFLESLRDQMAVLGKSVDDVNRLRAAQLGVGETAAPLILQLQNMRAAQQFAAQAARDEAAAQREAAAAKSRSATVQQSFLAGLRDQVALQDKSQADTLRYRAAQLGVAADAEKYIAQLDRTNAATAKIGVSTAQTTQALRQLPAQFTDIVTSLQGGQAPLTVLLQQGGQIKDSFGGVGNALKSVGGYVVGLISPLTVAVAAVVALGFAWHAGNEEGQAYARALVLTGNAASVTVGQLQAMARAQSQVVGTQGAAAAALTALAGTGQVVGSSLRLAAEAAVRFTRAGGDLGDIVKKFTELGRDPLDSLVKLNSAEHFLTESTYKQVKALIDQGRETDAAAVAQQAYANTVISRTKDVEVSLGSLQKLWKGVGDFAANAWDRMADVGRAGSPQESLEKTIREINALEAKHAQQSRPAFGSSITTSSQDAAALNQRRATLELTADALREQLRLEAKMLTSQHERDELESARIKWLAEQDKYLSKQQLAEKEIAAIKRQGLQIDASQAEIQIRIAAVRAKYADQGGDNELAQLRAKLKETNDYIVLLNKQGATTRELNDGERAALRIREQLKDNLTATVKAQKDKALAVATELGQRERLAAGLKEDIETNAKLAASVGQQADAIRQRALDQEAANAVYGLGKSAVEALTLAELKKQAQDLEATDSIDPKYLANLYAKIEAQKRFAEALRQSDFKQLNQGLDEWLRSAGEQKRLFADEAQLAGLTRLEREKVVAARTVELKLATELAKIDRSDLGEAQKDVLRIKAREAAEIESSNAVAKVMRDDMDRTADYIQQSLTDALINGGKSGAEYIEGLFRAMVLRPVVQAIVQPIAGTVSGYLQGLMGTVSGGGGSGDGSGSLLNSFTSAFSLLKNGLGTALSDFRTWFSSGPGLSLVNSSIGQSLGLSSTQVIGGNAIAGPTAAGNSLLSGVSTFAPYAALIAIGMNQASKAYSQGYSQNNLPWTATWLGTGGIAPPSLKFDTNLLTKLGVNEGLANTITGASLWSKVVNKLFGSVGTAQHGASYVSDGTAGQAVNGGGFGLDRAWGDSIGQYFSQDLQTALKGITGGAATVLNEFSKAFGGAAGYQVGAFFASDNNRASQGNRSILQNGQVVSSWSGNNLDKDPGVGLQQLTDALAGQVKSALQTIDVPEWAKTQLAALSGSATFTDLATAVQSILDTKQALLDLGHAMPQLANLSSDAATSLLSAFKGIDGLKTAASAYYDNFYSDAEKTQAATTQLSDAVASLGLQVPTTREAFRSLVEAQDLTTESGRAAYAGLLKLSPAFAALVPATAAAAASVDDLAVRMAEAGKKALADLAEQRGSLQVDLLNAQGDAAGAAALARQQALAKITSGLTTEDAAAATAAYDFIAAMRLQISTLNDAAVAAQLAAAADAARLSQRDSIQARIDDLQGNTAAIRERELAALDPLNRDLQELYNRLVDQQTASQAAAQAAQELAAADAVRASQRDSVQARIDDLEGNTAAIRARELQALDPLNRALQQHYYDLVDQQTATQAAAAAAQNLADAQRAVAAEGAGIQARIDDLEGNTAAIRARELEVLDPLNRALQQHYYDLVDQQTATQAAAAAAQDLANAQRAVAAEGAGIQARIDDLEGNTAAIRARELQALDPLNRALQQHYYELLDQQVATKAATAAAEEQSRAAQQLRDAWKSVGDTLLDEVNRIRGIGGTDSNLTLAQAQSRFAIATGQARAFDQDAAKSLPGLSQSLLELLGNNATSRAEVDRAQAQIAASLETTAGILGAQFGFSTQPSTPGVDVQALLAQIAATAPITSTAAAAQQQSAAAVQDGMAALVAEVKALRVEVQALQDPASRTASATERTRDLITQVTDNGNAMQVQEAS